MAERESESDDSEHHRREALGGKIPARGPKGLKT